MYFLTAGIAHVTHMGNVSLRGTLITTMSCSMRTRKFPFDAQACVATFFSMQNENVTAVKSSLEVGAINFFSTFPTRGTLGIRRLLALTIIFFHLR